MQPSSERKTKREYTIRENCIKDEARTALFTDPVRTAQ